MNNLYHNEILCMFIFEKFFQLNKTVEIEKLYLLLPFIFDEKVMKKISRITKLTNLVDYVLNDPSTFARQKQLFFEYLLLTTNTLQLCIENKLLELNGNTLEINENNCIFNDYNFESNKPILSIMKNLPKFAYFIQNEKSYELYHTLRIEV